MKIKIATMTGPNDLTHYDSLRDIWEGYPFVEWGILVSKSQEGSPRFPTRQWIDGLLQHAPPEMRLSAHVCGKWVRQICKEGVWALPDGTNWSRFQRIQLNFHAQTHERGEPFFELLKSKGKEHQFIVQLDGVNNAVIGECIMRGINAVPIFDLSGGAGVLPDVWPRPIEGALCAYAGGLGPHNIRDQLKRIEEVVGDAEIAVDMETHIRSDDDKVFVLDKVRTCLDEIYPYAVLPDKMPPHRGSVNRADDIKAPGNI